MKSSISEKFWDFTEAVMTVLAALLAAVFIGLMIPFFVELWRLFLGK